MIPPTIWRPTSANTRIGPATKINNHVGSCKGGSRNRANNQPAGSRAGAACLPAAHRTKAVSHHSRADRRSQWTETRAGRGLRAGW